MATEFLLFGFLYWMFLKPHAPGRIMGLYLVISSVARFLIEFTRFHEQGLHLGLSLTLMDRDRGGGRGRHAAGGGSAADAGVRGGGCALKSCWLWTYRLRAARRWMRHCRTVVAGGFLI